MALLGDKAVGDIVKLNVSGVATDFIIVHQGIPSDMYDESCDGTWLLMKDIYEIAKYDDDESDADNDYQQSDMNLNFGREFLNLLDSDINSAIKQVKIPWCENAQIVSGSNGISAKIFLLSGYEVGFTTSDNANLPIDGTKLSYFENGLTTSARDKRIAYYNGNAASWWLRSPYLADNYCVMSVIETGGCYYYKYYSTVGVRPALILPPSLSVDLAGYVTLNTAPTITSSTASGTNLGEISDGFDLSYSVNDEEGNPMTVSEYVDDVIVNSLESAEGGTYTFSAVSGENWKTILNGSHTLKIVANDGKNDSDPYTVTFNKQVRTATVSLAEPLPADDLIRAAVVAVSGHFPEDSTLTILVTNNALDDEPVWEDMTREFKQNANHVFANQTAENGFAFNFKVTATRGASDEQGYISSIGGAFE